MLESQNILRLQLRLWKPRINTKCLVHGRAIDIMNINDVYGPSRRQVKPTATPPAACQRGAAELGLSAITVSFIKVTKETA